GKTRLRGRTQANYHKRLEFRNRRFLMPSAAGQSVRNVLVKYEKDILAEWIRLQLAATTLRADLMKESELREQSRDMLSLLRPALETGKFDSMESSDWVQIKEFLAGISRTRAQQGFSPTE